MPYKDPDYMKKWRTANKEKTKAYNKDDYAERRKDPAFREQKRKNANAHFIANREEHNLKSRAWYTENKERVSVEAKLNYDPLTQREKVLKLKYGISLEEYSEILTAQEGRCAICRTENPGPRIKVFCVDHDHITSAVRGLLCSTCNRALGLFKDSRPMLDQASSYLKKFEPS